MQVRYHELRQKHVRTADGHDLGRVTDFLAERHGDSLCVSALIIGSAGILRRIGIFHSRAFEPMPMRQIPWHFVKRIDKEIHLSLDLQRFNRIVPMPEDDGENETEKYTA